MSEHSARKLQVLKSLSYLLMMSSGCGLTVREMSGSDESSYWKNPFYEVAALQLPFHRCLVVFFLCLCAQDLYSLLFPSSRS